MKFKKYLKIAGGVLFALFALSCAMHIPIALKRLHQANVQADNEEWTHIVGYLFGSCAAVIIWGGVSFYLFRSATKTKEKPTPK